MPSPPADATTNILLAEDDLDDCFLFADALKELQLPSQVSFVHNGEQLLQHLTDNNTLLPHIIFLDLNMPRKNGLTSLIEIKNRPDLKHIPVIVYSTAYQPNVIDMLYHSGAHYYIRKPNNFSGIKEAIRKAITLIVGAQFLQPSRENFVLTQESQINEIKEHKT